QTPLHFAAAQGHADVVKLLLEHKANINAPMSHSLYVNAGATPLQLALAAGHVEVIRLLVEKGALPKFDKRMRDALLRQAISQKRLKLVLWLEAEGTRIDPKEHGGWTPLHLAAELGGRDMVGKLLAKGADLKAVNSMGGFTPLHHAVQGRHKEIVELLLKRGADINPSGPGSGLLMIPVVNGDVEMARFLLDKGVKETGGSLYSSL